MQINRITQIFLLSLGMGISSSMSWANSVKDASSDQEKNSESVEPARSGLLDQIPRLIDATPTILPEQSNTAIVPPTL